MFLIYPTKALGLIEPITEIGIRKTPGEQSVAGVRG
jgi:hypothetical protein